MSLMIRISSFSVLLLQTVQRGTVGWPSIALTSIRRSLFRLLTPGKRDPELRDSDIFFLFLTKFPVSVEIKGVRAERAVVLNSHQ